MKLSNIIEELGITCTMEEKLTASVRTEAFFEKHINNWITGLLESGQENADAIYYIEKKIQAESVKLEKRIASSIARDLNRIAYKVKREVEASAKRINKYRLPKSITE